MARLVRVLFLAELLTDGGTAKHLAELLPCLRDAGIEPVVWSRGQQGRYARRLQQRGIPLEALPSIERPLLMASRTRGIELVHSYLYGPHLSDALICTLRRIPYLKSTRNTGHWLSTRPAVALRVAIRRPLIRHHLVNSGGVADYLVDKERVERARINVIPNGMLDRHEEGPTIAREEIGLAPSDFVMLSVAWLKSRKSLDFLIRALAVLKPRHGNLKLVLVGDGPEEAALRGLAAELGVSDACRFLGRHGAPHALARIADVAVSASAEEGMSNALIEAQMMSLPVVACEGTAGNADIVTTGVNGCLYEFGDQQAFQGCIESLCADPRRLHAMREASRRNFCARFTMAAQVRSFVELYRRILE